jgi:mono/diheme cytochrome c family protein
VRSIRLPVRLLPVATALAAACSAPGDRQGIPADTAAAATADSTRSLELVTPAGTRRLTLAQLRAALRTDTASVAQDPSYERRAKRYVGFPLEDVLALAGLRPSPDEVLYFTASDGFRATLSEAPGAGGVHGMIAFADLDAPGGWELLGHGADRKSPAPFYLVWTGADTAAAARRPWPYQLVRIEVVDLRRQYDRIYPTGVAQTDPVYRGYRAFVVTSRKGDQCVSCHSLNLQGGAVGPELNVPRNITEYRDDATLMAFIRNPRAFRARSPMPAFESDLTEQELRDILAYLHWLRDRKIAVDSAGRP